MDPWQAGYMRPDRRRARRVPTHRRALYRLDERKALLHEGVVRDASSTGLLICVQDAAPAHTTLELEVYGPHLLPGARPLLITGRVARVTSLEAGGFALGIALDWPWDSTHPPADVQSRAPEDSPTHQIHPAPTPSRRRARRWPWLAALALGLLLTALLTPMAPLVHDSDAQRWGGPVFRSAIAAIPSERSLGDNGHGEPFDTERHDGPERITLFGAAGPVFELARVVTHEESSIPTRVPAAMPPLALRDAEQALRQGAVLEALAGFEAIENDDASSPEVRAHAALGRAQVLAALEDFPAAHKALEAVGPHRDRLAPFHQAAFERLSAVLAGQRDVREDGGPWTDAAREKENPAASNDKSEAAKHPGLYIEVRKSAYSLVLYEGGRPVRSYRVGLGTDGATPEGNFVIANKIADPDWYNRGEVIPAGDPRNELGASWMGLGRGGRATSYGIHPTSHMESLGQDESRGCIRMAPDDAADLFARIPLGTPVCIKP